MTTNLDIETLAVLHAIATPDEVDQLVGILQALSTGHLPAWQIDFVIEIIRRLAHYADERIEK